MIQLTALLTPGVVPGPTPAGFPFTTTSDFALALADVMGARVASPVAAAPSEGGVQLSSPRHELAAPGTALPVAAAVAGAALPDIVLVPGGVPVVADAEPAAVPAPSPAPAAAEPAPLPKRGPTRAAPTTPPDILHVERAPTAPGTILPPADDSSSPAGEARPAKAVATPDPLAVLVPMVDPGLPMPAPAIVPDTPIAPPTVTAPREHEAAPSLSVPAPTLPATDAPPVPAALAGMPASTHGAPTADRAPPVSTPPASAAQAPVTPLRADRPEPRMPAAVAAPPQPSRRTAGQADIPPPPATTPAATPTLKVPPAGIPSAQVPPAIPDSAVTDTPALRPAGDGKAAAPFVARAATTVRPTSSAAPPIAPPRGDVPPGALAARPATSPVPAVDPRIAFEVPAVAAIASRPAVAATTPGTVAVTTPAAPPTTPTPVAMPSVALSVQSAPPIDAVAPTLPQAVAPAVPTAIAAPAVDGANARAVAPATLVARPATTVAPPRIDTPLTAAARPADAAAALDTPPVAVTVTVVALPSAPSAPPPPMLQPAGQAFAAAMFAAAEPVRAQDERRADPASLAVTATHAAAPQATGVLPVTATDAGQQPALDLTRADWMTSMIDRIETLRDEGGAVREARMKLAPDALGRIEVSVHRDEQGALQVRIAADTPQARAMLADAAPRLAEMAEQRGVRLGGTSVDAGTAFADQGARRDAQQPHPSAPLRNRPGTAPADTGDASADTRIA